MNYDGWVTIGTNLDNTELDKDLKNAKNKLKEYEREAKNLTKQKAKVDIDLSAYEKEKQQIKETTELTLQQAQTTEQTNAVIEQEAFELEQLNQKYSETFLKNESINKAIAENVNQQQLLNEQIQQMNNKINQIEDLEKIKNQISDVIKSVGKWALAVFSIRSAYSLIRGAISTLSQYNKNIANDIEYMRFAIANALKPIIEWIIKACYTILKLIGQIIYFITGINIFKSSGVDDFNKSLNSANKTLGKMKKQLAGFDEMNILQDDGSTSVGGGGGGLDLSIPDLGEGIEDVGTLTEKIGSLTNKFLELRENIKKSLADPSLFAEIFGNFDILFYGITEVINGINDAFIGIIETVGGVLDIVVGIFTLNGNKILEGINWVIKGIGDIFNGLISIISGIVDTIFGAIKGVIFSIWDFTKWLYNNIISIFSGIGNWFYQNVINPISSFFSSMWSNLINGASNAWEGIKVVFSTVADFFGNIFSEAWTRVKKVFSTGGQIFLGIKEGIFEAFKKIVNTLIDGINKVVATPFNALNNTLNKIRSTNILGIKPFSKLWSQNPIKVPKIPRLAKGGILSQPGRGVPVSGGRAIAGEAGREGYLPLTDAQVMAQLGAEIGRNVVIELTNITKLDNRQIAREQKRITTQNEFAFNS